MSVFALLLDLGISLIQPTDRDPATSIDTKFEKKHFFLPALCSSIPPNKNVANFVFFSHYNFQRSAGMKLTWCIPIQPFPCDLCTSPHFSSPVGPKAGRKKFRAAVPRVASAGPCRRCTPWPPAALGPAGGSSATAGTSGGCRSTRSKRSTCCPATSSLARAAPARQQGQPTEPRGKMESRYKRC